MTNFHPTKHYRKSVTEKYDFLVSNITSFPIKNIEMPLEHQRQITQKTVCLLDQHHSAMNSLFHDALTLLELEFTQRFVLPSKELLRRV